MSNSVYAMLTRQTGLMKEMGLVANNVANLSTSGFRAEGVIFTEHVKNLEGPQGSLSMASAAAHLTDLTQGGLRQTGGQLDLAVEGEGFFQVETPAGLRLTRNGAFFATPEGDMVTADGYRVLDAGGAPVFLPLDAGEIVVAPDGTLSADGNPVAQIGLFTVENVADLTRDDGVSFAPEGPVLPVETPRILQGFLEASNVDPVLEIARMIEVQRGYEMGQGFLEREDQRLRSVLNLVGR